MDAQQYDEARDRRRRKLIIGAVLAGMILAWFAFHLRNYPERRAVEKFFAALQQQDFEKAYAIWQEDPDWKKHADRYSKYGFGDFSRDWGPAGDWGKIKSYSLDCSYSSGSGVTVQVTVNQRAEQASVRVDKSDKRLYFPPPGIQIDCGNWFGWLTE